MNGGREKKSRKREETVVEQVSEARKSKWNKGGNV
jgi:hypothetical protein